MGGQQLAGTEATEQTGPAPLRGCAAAPGSRLPVGWNAGMFQEGTQADIASGLPHMPPCRGRSWLMGGGAAGSEHGKPDGVDVGGGQDPVLGANGSATSGAG